MPRTTVFGVYDQGTYGAVERVNDHVAVPPEYQPRQRGWRIVAKQAVLAAGAHRARASRSRDNDRPGVMLASAVRSYVNRFGVAPGKRAVVFATCDDGWRTAETLAAAGVEVVALVDARDGAAARDEAHPWRVIQGAVESAHGGHHLRGVTVRDANGSRIELACDLLAIANGWNPSLHLTCHLGGRPVWNDAINAFVPGDAARRACASAAPRPDISPSPRRLADGARLGAEAAYAAGFDAELAPICRKSKAMQARRPRRCGGSRAAEGTAFVDLQNDVTVKDIALAQREGYGAVEHLKRYTTLGMATDQGKTANVVGLAIMAELTGRSIPETGTTMFRPPYAPISFGALAGQHRGTHFRPKRLPPSHGWAEDARRGVRRGRAVAARAMVSTGLARSVGRTSVAREAATVRAAVGVCDVSTLGKIDIQGPDAARLSRPRLYQQDLSRWRWAKRATASCCARTASSLDDGTVARLGRAALRHHHHHRQCRQGDAASRILPPGVVARARSPARLGHRPMGAIFHRRAARSRDVLRKLVDADFDISNEALPRMGVAERHDLRRRAGAPVPRLLLGRARL